FDNLVKGIAFAHLRSLSRILNWLNFPELRKVIKRRLIGKSRHL
ncbi:MAG: hypothetical protein ACI9T7_001388, partial [Oleiphilaceae bacterium]